MTERSPERVAAIRALLPIAAGRGWNWGSLRAAMLAAGQDPALAESLFPRGPVGAVEAWLDLLNQEMEAAAVAEDIPRLRVPARIRRLVAWRLTVLAPHKQALRRAMALLALPWNAGVALRASAATADAMWHAAGDASADFSWYTRRATLAALYAATIAYWLRDDSTETREALAFFDRRLAEQARLGRAIRRVRPRAA
ncbi:COQ9 family protein [Siccirubricoccus sp. KC 17139]|uniref:COQ9 family protein n=1 Tax=Siccirubricoccus soli TaxID=2899147 RepID=A0ABT1D826_9PROT|nr:COQ9 family protein [Siccirubricoccus soli]MCO6417329.1 COQ9 family protein [Siccirubricoccus soli]MCP2683464.1 COQ9 family protein [Siccirubricoccus soli]